MKHPEELNIHDWQSLDEGQTIRVNCSHWKCQNKKAAFTITRTFDGCVYNCYRCGITGGIYTGSTPTSAIKKLRKLRYDRKNNSVSIHNNVVLPNDFIHMVTHDKLIPAAAYAWIYQYELNDDDIFKYNIGYAHKLQRVVIPIYDIIRLASGDTGYKLIGWQGRDIYYKHNKELYNNNIIKYQPIKYYTEITSKSNNNQYQLINKNKIYYKIISKYNNNKIIYIVEDILSCIKVYNKYKKDTIALLNSTISDKLITTLRDYKHVDWDARIRAIKASRRCQDQGITTSTIRTKKDPKAIPYKKM